MPWLLMTWRRKGPGQQSWNLALFFQEQTSLDARIYWKNLVYTMPADALALNVIKSSSAMAWIMYRKTHYCDVIMGAMGSQFTSLTIVHSTVYSGVDQRKHQSSASLAFLWEITGDRWIPAQMASNAEMFPFDDVIMYFSMLKISAVRHWTTDR